MNYRHTDTLTENDWEMINAGNGFALTDEEAKEMALDILDTLDYDVHIEKRKEPLRCPACESRAFLVGERNTPWGESAELDETFHIACQNICTCGMRSVNYLTEEEALEGWERICEKIKS